MIFIKNPIFPLILLSRGHILGPPGAFGAGQIRSLNIVYIYIYIYTHYGAFWAFGAPGAPKSGGPQMDELSHIFCYN